MMMMSFQIVMIELIFQQRKVLKGLWMYPLKVFPVLMYQLRHNKKNVGSRSVTELDPSADLVSSRVPDPSDKREEIDDFGSFCILDEMPLEPCDNEVILSSPLILLVPLLMQLTMLKIFLGDIPHSNTCFQQSYKMNVTMQTLLGLS